MKEALNKMQNPSEQSMCWQDGRLFEDKEDWIVDSCTKCTCQEGKVVCRQITCPPVACANPSFIDGECCPVCLRKWRRMHTDTLLFFVHFIKFFIYAFSSNGQWGRLVSVVRVDTMHSDMWKRHPAAGTLLWWHQQYVCWTLHSDSQVQFGKMWPQRYKYSIVCVLLLSS